MPSSDNYANVPGKYIIYKEVMRMKIEEMLKKARLRVTKQRLSVLELLIAKGIPLSHSEITLLLNETFDRVTLYRTLETLAKAGIVHQVQGLDGAWRFCAHDSETKGCPGGHPHFICLKCGRMFCLDGQNMPRVSVPEGMTVEGKQYVIYGKCGECAAKSEDK